MRISLTELVFQLCHSNYIESVRNYGDQKLSLRDKDRLLWGKSFYEQLQRDIKSGFIRN